MKIRLILTFLMTLILFQLVQAGECGNGLPCGSIPWPQPNPPALTSPTPMPTIGVTINPPTQTPGGPTATPAPTNVSFDIDVSGINDQFATLNALAEATDQPVEVNGTPVSSNEQLSTLTANSGTFFSYVRAVNETDLGGLNPLLGFITISFLTVLTVKVITLSFPLLSAIFGLLRKLIGIVLDFLPF